MKIGFVGLGRMGGNMVKRLIRSGHTVAAYARSPEGLKLATSLGAEAVSSLEGLAGVLQRPRTVWVMVPAGAPVQQSIDALVPHLSKGDLLIDGGNSHYPDSVRRGDVLQKQGIAFLDCGTSGGIWGLERGYCLMIGGAEEDFRRVEPIFRALAPPEGYARVGPTGAGHFVKMVHNGIEYAMLQAYGEGFELLAKAAEFDVDLRRVAQLWNQGSVVRSWLLELAERAFAEDRKLEKIHGYVEDSGEGRWTALDAVNRGVPATAMTHALFARFVSRQEDSFAVSVIAALRNEFGGHAVKGSE